MRRTASGIACGVVIGLTAAIGARAVTGPAPVSAPAVTAICPDPGVAPGDVHSTPDARLCGARDAAAASAGPGPEAGRPGLRLPPVVTGLACASAAAVLDLLDHGCRVDGGGRG